MAAFLLTLYILPDIINPHGIKCCTYASDSESYKLKPISLAADRCLSVVHLYLDFLVALKSIFKIIGQSLLPLLFSAFPNYFFLLLSSECHCHPLSCSGQNLGSYLSLIASSIHFPHELTHSVPHQIPSVVFFQSVFLNLSNVWVLNISLQLQC